MGPAKPLAPHVLRTMVPFGKVYKSPLGIEGDPALFKCFWHAHPDKLSSIEACLKHVQTEKNIYGIRSEVYLCGKDCLGKSVASPNYTVVYTYQ